MGSATSAWFDVRRLEEWLTGRLNDGRGVNVLTVERITGGQSAETYRLRTLFAGPDGAQERGLVLRRDPEGGLVERDIAREFGVMRALADSPIPLPRVYALELDPGWLGRPFFVDEALPGTADRNLFNAPAFAAHRPLLGAQFVDLLAKMHRLDVDKWNLAFLGSPGEGRLPALREVDLWEDLFRRRQREPNSLLVEAFLWMRANAPLAPRVSLVHGEYRPGNFLYDGPRLIAVLDWEYAHLGDPNEDLGWAFMKQFRVGDCESGFFAREEFLERYEAGAGWAVDREAVRFWEVFSNMKVVCIGITGQDAFCRRTMDFAPFAAGPTMNVYAEIVRLTGL
ncbi:MAG: phosphotransferase family protein [Dehalococcoidia bacterium]|nr:phosphotransferase family protein [Dehalococcoidia bacterium]